MEKLNDIKLSNILFLDIETVSLHSKFDELSPVMQQLWDHKSKRLQIENQTAREVYHKAGIFAEFGKIVCISVAFIKQRGSDVNLRVKSFAGDDEFEILTEFSKLVTKHFNKPQHYFCAHNGKEFDFPFIARRMLINNVPIPYNIDTRGLKPWDVKHLDTLDLWRFGDYKNYTSLKLLSEIFGIQTPKNDIDGSMVYSVYWEENDLSRIVEYCQKDVVAVVQLFQKYRGEEPIPFDKIDVVL